MASVEGSIFLSTRLLVGNQNDDGLWIVVSGLLWRLLFYIMCESIVYEGVSKQTLSIFIIIIYHPQEMLS